MDQMNGREKKKILIISFSNLRTDPRVLRQLFFLKQYYTITAVGYNSPEIDGVRFIPVVMKQKNIVQKAMSAIKLKTGDYEGFYQDRYDLSRLPEIQAEQYNLVIANEIDAMPLAVAVAGNAPILYDAHEYSPKEFEDSARWRFFFQKYKIYLCERYIRKAAAMTTVCGGIVQEYGKMFGVSSEVILNAPPYQDIAPSAVDGRAIRMIHHGIAFPSRKIETMIDMMNFIDDRFSIDFMLKADGTTRYLGELRKRAEGNKKIRFIDPVPINKVVDTLSRYDVGIYIIQPTNFNNKHCLPNKLFEFIQARLAVAIGPSPEMAVLVRQYDCGVVAGDFSPQSLAAAVRGLDAGKIRYYKDQSAKAARELSAEINMGKLHDMIKRIII